MLLHQEVLEEEVMVQILQVQEHQAKETTVVPDFLLAHLQMAAVAVAQAAPEELQDLMVVMVVQV
jgi:hypothetical protein